MINIKQRDKTLEKANLIVAIMIDLVKLEDQLAELLGVPVEKDMPPPTPKKGAKHPCCGSKQKRHKKTCTTQATPDLKTYVCPRCDKAFKDERDYLDVICPSCGGTGVVQK